ncbi:MAG: trigger factor [Pseudobacteriovorax sp.]|nr:trigger factor [Pseudobacteriovorax sp.]
MKSLVEEVNSVQRRIKVELSQEDVKNEFDNVYKRLRKKAKIKGFRPGKAPIGVIRKFYGNSVAMDVADQLVKTHLFSAIKEESLQPIAAPVLETAELPVENEPFSFSAVVDILPAIKIDGYKGLEISYEPTKADTAALDRELEVLQRRQAKTEDLPVDTLAEAGHQATVTQKGSLDGEEFPPLSFESVDIELGKGQLVEEIESQILGMKAGEEKTIEVTIPESVQDPSFVGKTVVCQTQVSSLKKLNLPELNDELAKEIGLDSLDALKTNIQERLDQQVEQANRNLIEANILDQLAAKNEFDVPPSMVDQVIDGMFDEFQFPNDEARKEAKADPEKRKELLDTAKQRTKNTLILSEIIKAEGIEVNEDDLNEHVKGMLASYGGKSEDIDDKMIEIIKASMGNQARESLLFKKAIDFVVENGSLTETAPKS